MCLGLCADLIGVLALKFFTPKKDALTVFIKFGLRCIVYALAFILNTWWGFIIAISWSILISTAYENKISGRFINKVDIEHQLSFSNVTYLFKYVGTSLGTLLCGVLYDKGIKYIFGASSAFIVIQILFLFYALNLYKKEKKY